MSAVPPRLPMKPPQSAEQLADLLIARGLQLSCRSDLLHALRYIGYYRFSGYCRPFQVNSDHQFQAGSSFEQILEIYTFDRKLRTLVMDGIERIEVATRTVISNTLAEHYQEGSWYLRHELFQDEIMYTQLVSLIGELMRKQEEYFIKHHIQHYSPAFPPSWMLSEGLSLGTWSRIYANLKPRELRTQISEAFGLHHLDFGSWLRALTYLRNLCAHHARLWNRTFTIKPTQQPKGFEALLQVTDRFYAQAVMLHALLKVISPTTNWAHDLSQLLVSHPSVALKTLGFSSDWEKDPFWGILE